jgi:hypothetical protein
MRIMKDATVSTVGFAAKCVIVSASPTFAKRTNLIERPASDRRNTSGWLDRRVIS